MSAADEKAQTPFQRLTSLLGEEVFFIPCELGTKKPLVTHVERPFEATKSGAYRALFEVQEVNVAVYLELRLSELEVIRRADPACLETEPRSQKLFVSLSRAIRRLVPEERRIELYLKAAQHLEAVSNPEPGKPDLL